MSSARPSGRELREHQVTWQAASLLLSYPDERLLGYARLLRAAIANVFDG
jgi:nitrate reductase assembly molybdenum cofactor insertion protein NarJ